MVRIPTLTEDQSQALRNLLVKQELSKDYIIDNQDNVNGNNFNKLKSLSRSELAKAVYVDYSVDSDICLHDVVVLKHSNTLVKIIDNNHVLQLDVKTVLEGDNYTISRKEVKRKATPTEIKTGVKLSS